MEFLKLACLYLGLGTVYYRATVITCPLMGLFYDAFSCGFEFVIYIPKSICFGNCCVSPYSVDFKSCTVHSKCLFQIRHKGFKIFRPNICHRLNSLASLA